MPRPKPEATPEIAETQGPSLADVLAEKDARIAALEAEVAKVRADLHIEPADRLATVLSDPAIAYAVHHAVTSGQVRFSRPWTGDARRQTIHDAISGAPIAEVFRTAITPGDQPDVYGVRVFGVDGKDASLANVKDYADRMLRARGVLAL